ncbi:AAA domain-containing protein [Kocuria sp. CPCC 205300]|uniref:AAA domain-containing protein n=1 Tax=Kocuria sabuli TaxID=3071448 RepID=UPI0036DA2C35
MTDTIDDQYADLREALVDHLFSGGRLAVVKAPPGSGKTFTLVEVLTSLVAEGWRVAVAAQTNSQADDICRRFAHDHPEVAVARFSSKGTRPPPGFPPTVPWISDRAALPGRAGVTVATTAKWSLTDLALPYDLLAIDEAWQMSWADMMQCALISEKFLMIGDPGQIPPVVTIDVRRWETSPRAPHEAAPSVVLGEPALEGVRFVGSLPACRRLPHESVEFVKPFYDFDFKAYVAPTTRGVDFPSGHRLAPLADGRPLVLTVPTPDHGPPIEVDHELAAAAAVVVEELLGSDAMVRDGHAPARPLMPEDIGISSSHRVMNAALTAVVARWAGDLRVDTPERWQGLERPVMIAVHPLSGVLNPSAFDLETGRLCVMASRHQAGLILLTRDHIGNTLANFVPSAGQAPGRPDMVGRGHDAHLRFWEALQSQQRLIPFG